MYYKNLAQKYTNADEVVTQTSINNMTVLMSASLDNKLPLQTPIFGLIKKRKIHQLNEETPLLLEE